MIGFERVFEDNPGMDLLVLAREILTVFFFGGMGLGVYSEALLLFSEDEGAT